MIYKIEYKILNKHAKPPTQARPLDAGHDLFVTSVSLLGNGYCKVGCGLAFDFSPVGVADVRARSSIYKMGLILSNGVGTIDAGYRGEVFAVFHAFDNARLYKLGDRFAQLVFPTLSPYDRVQFVLVDELSDSERGANGYGSSGV